MINLNVLEVLDEAIVSVRGTDYHEVQYGDNGCDGTDIGVVYSDVEEAVHEAAVNIQSSYDALTEHLRLKELECQQLADDRDNAIKLMQSSWRHAATKEDDILTRFVEMANNQFEIRDKLADDNEALKHRVNDLDCACKVSSKRVSDLKSANAKLRKFLASLQTDVSTEIAIEELPEKTK